MSYHQLNLLQFYLIFVNFLTKLILKDKITGKNIKLMGKKVTKVTKVVDQVYS